PLPLTMSSPSTASPCPLPLHDALPIFISSIITSINETTLISACRGVRSPRPRRRMLEAALAGHQRDDLGAEAVEFAARLNRFDRSEEHTSELQSREKLVCRLLLEKKNA